MSMKSVRLELARDHDYPQGSASHGYEFVAPLDENGHIDAAQWRANKADCRVRRFWEGEDDEIGHLVHRNAHSWVFHYDVEGDPDEDEPGFRFDTHKFAVGEYVSIREQDGEMRTFKVASVKPAAL